MAVKVWRVFWDGEGDSRYDVRRTDGDGHGRIEMRKKEGPAKSVGSG